MERRGVCIALACRCFGISETYYRYRPTLKAEYEVISDLLIGPTGSRKTWGFGLCFLHLRNVKSHPWNHEHVYWIYLLDLQRTEIVPADQTSKAAETGEA